MQYRVVGQDVRATQIERRAVHIRAQASGFANQQDASRHVPRVQVEFPEHVQAATGNVCQVEGGRSRTPHSVGKHR